MHIVIVGSGKIGETVARWLVSAGHEVAVVERDRTKCNALDSALGTVSVLGDGSTESALEKAGANRADVVIATTSRDDINLAACQLSRHRFRVPRIISLVNTPDRSDLFSLLGVDVPIDVTGLAAGRIQEQVVPYGFVHLMPISGSDGKALVSIRMPLESGSRGRPLKNVNLPEGTLVALVIGRDGNASIPSEDTLLQAGDEVIAITASEAVEELKDLLVQGE